MAWLTLFSLYLLRYRAKPKRKTQNYSSVIRNLSFFFYSRLTESNWELCKFSNESNIAAAWWVEEEMQNKNEILLWVDYPTVWIQLCGSALKNNASNMDVCMPTERYLVRFASIVNQYCTSVIYVERWWLGLFCSRIDVWAVRRRGPAESQGNLAAVAGGLVYSETPTSTTFEFKTSEFERFLRFPRNTHMQQSSMLQEFSRFRSTYWKFYKI